MHLTLIAFGLLAILGLGSSQGCSVTEFLCEESSVCVPKSRICDGIVDCLSGSDEVDCLATTTTPCPGFQCNNGSCIPANWQCDSEVDCELGEDEENCPSTSTTPCSGFVCNDDSCIPDWYECDGHPDCQGAEDEDGCPCDGFLCPSKRCIPDSWVCDGYDDCGDYSDESVDICPCGENEVRCPELPDSHIPAPCIPPDYFCDQIWDCPEGADETNCTKTVDIHSIKRYRPKTIKTGNIHRTTKDSEKRQSERKHKIKSKSHYHQTH